MGLSALGNGGSGGWRWAGSGLVWDIRPLIRSFEAEADGSDSGEST